MHVIKFPHLKLLITEVVCKFLKFYRIVCLLLFRNINISEFFFFSELCKLIIVNQLGVFERSFVNFISQWRFETKCATLFGFFLFFGAHLFNSIIENEEKLCFKFFFFSLFFRQNQEPQIIIGLG